MNFTRKDCTFTSHGDKCAAWLYMPDGVTNPSLVVMAHGFGGFRNCGLEPFAEAFAAEGIAVLLFDYRCFGLSEGTPRQWISPKRHVEDYISAVEWARQQGIFNSEKIGLWGSSFSGGHVMVVASKDPKIAAVSAQVPFVSGIASSTPIIIHNGFGFLYKAISSGLKDLWRAARKKEAYTVPVFSEPGDFAVLNTRDSKSGYESLIPEGFEVDNSTPARIFLTMSLYRPTRVVRKIKCPVLVAAGENDSLIPLKSVKRAVAKIKNAEFIQLPMDHFDPYLGESFKKVSEKQIEFFKKYL